MQTKFAIASKSDSLVFVTGCNSIEKDGLNWAHIDALEGRLDVIKDFDSKAEAEEFNELFKNVGEVVEFPTASEETEEEAE